MIASATIQTSWYKHHFKYDKNSKYYQFLKQPYYESNCQLLNDFITHVESKLPVKANKSKTKFLLNNDKIEAKNLTSEQIVEVIDEANNYVEAFKRKLQQRYG